MKMTIASPRLAIIDLSGILGTALMHKAHHLHEDIDNVDPSSI